MGCVASRHGSRSIVVNHDVGHSWIYDFSINTDEPRLHQGYPRWANAITPPNAGALTLEAEDEAVKLGRLIGLISEFQTEDFSAQGIRVRDVSSGHKWTFMVVVSLDGLRVLGHQVEVDINPYTHADHHPHLPRARNHAETEMLRRGEIDRKGVG